MIFSIHFSPFAFCVALKITTNIRHEALKRWFYALFDRKETSMFSISIPMTIVCLCVCESELQLINSQPNKTKNTKRNQINSRCYIKAEITINLRPFLILNWVMERFSPVLSHQLLSNPDVITVQ